MTDVGSELDEASLLKRFDRSAPDALLKSIAKEFVRLSQAQTALLARITALESLRTVVDRIASDENMGDETPYPSQVRVDAASSFIDATGFYALEHDHNGLAYRWTGPEPQFSFSFFIDRTKPAQFSLRFDQLYANVPVSGLRCFVDGEEAPLTVMTYIAGGHEVKGVLPPRKDRGGSVLAFVCPQMESPESRGLEDTRALGVAFRTLIVEPQPAPSIPAPAPTWTPAPAPVAGAVPRTAAGPATVQAPVRATVQTPVPAPASGKSPKVGKFGVILEVTESLSKISTLPPPSLAGTIVDAQVDADED